MSKSIFAYWRQRITILLTAVLLLPILSACTGQTRMLTIGVVNLSPLLRPVFEGFKAGMTEFGYVENVNIRYLYEESGTIDKLDPIVESYLAPEIDLILAISTPATVRAKALAESSKRIVFASVLDPLGTDIVPEIKQPGGNITGIRHGIHETKRMEWLYRVKPSMKKVYAPYNPNDGAAKIGLSLAQEAAKELGVEIIAPEAPDSDAVTKALEEMPEDIDAILLLADNLVASRLASGTPNFVSVSRARKVPLSVPVVSQVAQGGLISYAFDFRSLGRQSARLVDQVLRGVKPGDLPVETVEFSLVINQYIAKEIGLTIPDEILQQADSIVYDPPPPTATPAAEPTAAPTIQPTSAPTAAPTQATSAAETPEATAAATASAEPTAGN